MSASRIEPSPSSGWAPRTRATGRPATLPRASSAADAISSALARIVDFITRPSASGVPRRSSIGISPDTPIATSVMPQRHGRPNESDTMTGTSTPNLARMASRIARAEPSGSCGRRVTMWPLAGPTFDASMPPLAQMKPCSVSVIRTPCSIRTTRRASRRTTSIWRGSRSQRSANVIASGRGSIVSRSTIAPSAFETIFWVTTRTSSGRSGRTPAVASIASPIRPARSSPPTISGMPTSAIASTRPPASAPPAPRPSVRSSADIDRLRLRPGRGCLRRRMLGCRATAQARLGEEQILGRVEIER